MKKMRLQPSIATWAVLVLALVIAAPVAAASCPPQGWKNARLAQLKSHGFSVSDHAARSVLAVDLLDCLAIPDPDIRDGIGYAALAQWMRADQLPPEVLRAMDARLLPMLSAPDEAGFAAPFAALTLAEIARTDRVAAWMTTDERAAMLEHATRYVADIRDYRGYDSDQGWRHGVAHGADWLMQLALNPAIDSDQLAAIVEAVGQQVIPAGTHAYVFDEPGRLARPLMFAARRGVHDEEAWTRWFAALVPRLGDASLAWRDAGWLARRHNLAAFLHVLYVEASVSGDPRLAPMLAGLTAALKAMP